MSKMKNFGKGFGTFMKEVGSQIADNLAEANERAEAARVREQEARSAVEDAILKYEATTGRHFVVSTPSYTDSTLAWDPNMRGHLMSCPSTCRIKHCAKCGDKAWASEVFCSSCS